MTPIRRHGSLAKAHALWCEARWFDRLLFSGLLALFAVRAIYRAPHPDRLGFLAIGRGVLDGQLCQAPTNTYPPTFSVLMAPFAWLESQWGDLPVRLLWGGGQMAALAIFTLASSRALRVGLSIRGIALAWLCTWRYIVGDLNNQNMTLFLLALLATALAGFVRGQEVKAGLLIAVGAALKVFPGFAAIGLWRAGRGGGNARLAAGGALGALGAVALTVAALGPSRFVEALRFWLENILPSVGGPQLLNQSLKGFLLRTLPSARTGIIASGIGAGALLFFAVFVILRPARDRRVAALDAVLATLLSVTLLPFAWFHYFAAGMPICLALFCGRTELSPRPRRLILGLVLAGTAIGAFLDVDLVGRTVWIFAATYGNALFGALLVFAAGCVMRSAWQRLPVVTEEHPRGLQGDRIAC